MRTIIFITGLMLTNVALADVVFTEEVAGRAEVSISANQDAVAIVDISLATCDSLDVKPWKGPDEKGRMGTVGVIANCKLKNFYEDFKSALEKGYMQASGKALKEIANDKFKGKIEVYGDCLNDECKEYGIEFQIKGLGDEAQTRKDFEEFYQKMSFKAYISFVRRNSYNKTLNYAVGDRLINAFENNKVSIDGKQLVLEHPRPSSD